MTHTNFKKNYNKKTEKPKNKKIVGRVHFMEPIIISGKYFGIKLLSVYEFMQCLKMKNNLTKKLIREGLDKHICKKICEYACLTHMCLYDCQNNRVFLNEMDVIKNLTPEELKFVYTEYTKLTDKVLKKDNLTHGILETAKKYYYKKEGIL